MRWARGDSRFGWLLAQEARRLASGWSFWLLLALMGPLVGFALKEAWGLYAEASGIGGAAALPQGLSPLDGILVPTFGAYDVAATLLWPFVAIRLVAEERSSGAGLLLAQAGPGPAARLGAKALVLAGAWLLSLVPGLLALALWKGQGGHLHGAEVLGLLLGHALRAFGTFAAAVLAASVLDGASSAAIATLAFTVGTWALDLMAAGRGGWVQALAAFTPGAVLRSFEQGLASLSGAGALLAASLGAWALSGLSLRPGLARGARVRRGLLVLAGTAALALGAARLRASWDLSEDRRHSFAPAVAEGLRALPGPLAVDVHLAADDPRLQDLARLLRKLQRTVPLEVRYTAASRSGLFESDPRYGEIRWRLGDREAVTRSTTEPIVLDLVFGLAGRARPTADEDGYPGYPLARAPKGLGWTFLAAWPALVALAAGLIRRRPR